MLTALIFLDGRPLLHSRDVTGRRRHSADGDRSCCRRDLKTSAHAPVEVARPACPTRRAQHAAPPVQVGPPWATPPFSRYLTTFRQLRLGPSAPLVLIREFSPTRARHRATMGNVSSFLQGRSPSESLVECQWIICRRHPRRLTPYHVFDHPCAAFRARCTETSTFRRHELLILAMISDVDSTVVARQDMRKRI